MGQAKELYDRFWEHFHARDLDAAVALVSPESESKMPGIVVHGPDEVRQVLQTWLDAMSDTSHEVLDHIDAGDVYADEIRLTATHSGTLRTPGGDVPPTGRTITLLSAHLIRARDGKLVSWHSYWDQMAMLAALGVMPAPAAA